MARGITENDVWTACDALLLTGARPTIERVRQHIGSGSPNTVSPYLDTWFKGLGSRIKDPAAFAAAPELPDPIQQAAKHFWEVALAETRRDFDQRIQDGLAAALANIQAEKDKAAQAKAAADDASLRAARLKSELEERGQLFDQAQRDLAAERARLDEVRAALAASTERLRRQEESSAMELAELRRQMASATERADAADRRVALELERERITRAKVERHAQSLQKGIEALRATSAATVESLQQKLSVAREREKAFEGQHVAAVAELRLERQRLAELRIASEAVEADASTARSQAAGLQASLNRLVALVEARTLRESKPRPTRGVKASTRCGE
jgi:hypothetical protein